MDNFVSYSTTNNAIQLPKVLHNTIQMPGRQNPECEIYLVICTVLYNMGENPKTKNRLVIKLGRELVILRSKSTPVAQQERNENTFILGTGDNV